MNAQLEPNAGQITNREMQHNPMESDQVGWEYYVGEDGQPLYRRRSAGSTKSELERPNGIGGYMPFQIFSDLSPVLFNLPAVRKAAKRLEPIVLCNNEIEVHNFEKIGITATCSAVKWTNSSELSEIWHTPLIIITEEKLGPWEKLAHALEQNLTALPVLAENQTIEEWISDVESKDQFMNILEADGVPSFVLDDNENDSAALETEPSEIIFEPMVLKNWKDTIKEAKRQWIVDRILPEKSLSLISALPKAGKSTWSYSLAEAVSNGKPFMGHQVQQTPVLILALEEMDIDVKIRTNQEMNFNQENTYIWNGPLNCNKEILNKLGDFIEEHGIGLVVIDCLTRFWDIDDENSASQVNSAIKPILQIARSKKVAIHVIHHSTKTKAEFGKDIRGSGDLFAHVDIAFSLDRYVSDLTDTRRVLQTHSRYREIPKEIVIQLENGEYIELGDKERAKNTANEKSFLSALLKGPLSAKEIAGVTGFKEGTVRTMGESLFKANKINRVGKGSKGDPHKYLIIQNDSAEGSFYSSEIKSANDSRVIDKSLSTVQTQAYSPHNETKAIEQADSQGQVNP